MLPPHRIRELLRELDDPAHLRVPARYDVPAAHRRFARLTDALERRFGRSVTAGGVQDASLYGYVSVPAPATATDRPLWVLMSNFGPLVTTGRGTGWGVPGCEEGLDAAFVTWLDELCTELGCVYVPAELLLEPYDGPSRLEDDWEEDDWEEGGEEDEETEGDENGQDEGAALPLAWWDRYFQFM
ncbi:hypothetical protein [Streptomyces lancefieldiae]|uniref:SUKH-4 immunity protein of toxin-antitoxin system n=1 Tax=Streptomyces lancefieldiae TaxID=3075520 RepID=A0ABU3APL3_9ACTN|nr:hypothetical protein [Streptomyces sp. DSM 40712]MDT0611522.1 hypothetical protein [Streptomyces sp. DSM 40712]